MTKKTIRHIVLPSILACIVILPVILWNDTIVQLWNSERLIEYLERSSINIRLLFVFIQALQVVVFIIPGEITQIAGGHLFGFVQGTLLSVAGILCGSIIAYALGFFLGHSTLKIILKEQRYSKWAHYLDSRKGYWSIFIVFLTPGIPKDALTYIGGSLRIPAVLFIALNIGGRLAGIILSTLFGDQLAEQNWIIVAIICVVTLALMIVSIKNRNRT